MNETPNKGMNFNDIFEWHCAGLFGCGARWQGDQKDHKCPLFDRIMTWTIFLLLPLLSFFFGFIILSSI